VAVNVAEMWYSKGTEGKEKIGIRLEPGAVITPHSPGAPHQNLLNRFEPSHPDQIPFIFSQLLKTPIFRFRHGLQIKRSGMRSGKTCFTHAQPAPTIAFSRPKVIPVPGGETRHTLIHGGIRLETDPGVQLGSVSIGDRYVTRLHG
jgi:hypothetical protein